jgi:hypothetical protein
MGIFSKTPKPNPKIAFEGIEFTFHRDHEWWEFTYRGAEFCSFVPTLSLPTKAELDSIVSTVESLKPEMRKRLAKGLAEWGDDSKLDDGETYSISVEEFTADRSFSGKRSVNCILHGVVAWLGREASRLGRATRCSSEEDESRRTQWGAGAVLAGVS